MRRLLRDIAEGREFGDVTTLRDPDVMEELEQKVEERQAARTRTTVSSAERLVQPATNARRASLPPPITGSPWANSRWSNCSSSSSARPLEDLALDALRVVADQVVGHEAEPAVVDHAVGEQQRALGDVDAQRPCRRVRSRPSSAR